MQVFFKKQNLIFILIPYFLLQPDMPYLEELNFAEYRILFIKSKKNLV